MSNMFTQTWEYLHFWHLNAFGSGRPGNDRCMALINSELLVNYIQLGNHVGLHLF